ncbi:alpha/beta hydrolase [Pinisolibacter sp.]|uniref:alpha/beta hydrolase n=1 Tax=Pinisolibacter sp. TaxID=2172024 RepID=UPI002FDE8546
MTDPTTDVDCEWVHIQFDENPAFTETYGFSGSQGAVHLEGIRMRSRGVASRTLLVFMHPASTLQLLPLPRHLAAIGFHVLCAGSRYARNDTAAILEKVLLDLGAYIRHARTVWGYDHVVLAGWSGGGSLALFYQSQAERPTITATPAGDPVDIVGAGLIPADAVIFQAAHLSRARMLAEMIDPSVVDEADPDRRTLELDIYDPRNPNRPPYSADFLAEFRAAQLRRVRRITAGVEERLADLRRRGTGELERGLLTHRTMADPRFLDLTIDPNGRPPNWCYMGRPETVNNGPVGLARFSTLRAWLSQWSIDHSRMDGEACAAAISVPLLTIENQADDVVPQPHTGIVHRVAGSRDKTFAVIDGANHYYAGQPRQMTEASDLVRRWLEQRGFGGA